MAGGSLLKSKDAKADPKEIFNIRLLFLLCTIAWAGMFYGFDQVRNIQPLQLISADVISRVILGVFDHLYDYGNTVY